MPIPTRNRADQPSEGDLLQSPGTRPDQDTDHEGARREPRPRDVAEAVWTRLAAADRRVVAVLRRAALPALRLSLAVVFVWFGALKIADTTPVADLVASTVPFLPANWFVPALGVFEVLLGVGLAAGRGLRLVLLLFALQLLGTFLVLLVQPGVAFQDGNPLLLTVEGEFVVKNLVLLSAGLAVGARLRPARPWA